MSRFLHRVVSRARGRASDPHPFSGLFLASASPSAAGHLGLLARARSSLKDLLTPEALLLDATHALGAVAFNDQPHTGGMNRVLHDIVAPAELARAEARGDALAAQGQRVLMALLDVEDGRFHDALHAFGRVAKEYPGYLNAHLCVAALSDLFGQPDVADQWLAGATEEQRPREQMFYQVALVTATLGGALVAAAAGSEGRVASAAFHIIRDSVSKGQMSAFRIVIAALLKHATKRRCKDLALKREDGIFRAVADAVRALSGGGVDPEDVPFFVLQATQALLSAVVLRAPSLCGERVRAALRIAESDLARAVKQREAPAAVADLRLLAAFLAARDGRFDEALSWYAEVARDNPSDPRPHYLAHHVCLFGRMPAKEADRCLAIYERLAAGSSVDEQVALRTLADELVVALAMGGSLVAFHEEFPVVLSKIVSAAGSRVDAALVSALQGKKMSVTEQLEARACRALLHAGIWSSLKKLKRKNGGNGTTAD